MAGGIESKVMFIATSELSPPEFFAFTEKTFSPSANVISLDQVVVEG